MPQHSTGPSVFIAVDARSGRIAWKKRVPFERSSIWDLGKRLLMLSEDGKLVLASATPKAISIHAQHQITDAIARTVPTLVGTTLYVRDAKDIAESSTAPS